LSRHEHLTTKDHEETAGADRLVGDAILMRSTMSVHSITGKKMVNQIQAIATSMPLRSPNAQSLQRGGNSLLGKTNSLLGQKISLLR
jgi:hypothetical protein